MLEEQGEGGSRVVQLLLFAFCDTSKIFSSSSLPAVGLRRPWKDRDGQRGQ